MSENDQAGQDKNCIKRIFIAVLRDQKLYRIKLPHEMLLLKMPYRGDPINSKCLQLAKSLKNTCEGARF